MSENMNDFKEAQSESTAYCHNCGQPAKDSYKFCSACGAQLISASNMPQASQIIVKQQYSSKMIISIISVAGLILAAGYFLNPWLIGKAPVGKKSVAELPIPADQLYDQAEKALKAISESANPGSAELLEAVDLLSRILQGSPKDSWALIQLAELSFNQRMFDKASGLYARYLEENPEDQTVRSRYASALTFAGKSAQAISELEKVLAKSPDNFQALAFSAIAHSESGQKEKAKELLAKALSHAPNEEAKSRLGKFAESIDNPAPAAPQTNQLQTSSNSSDALATLETYLKNHQIAGPKFKGIKSEADAIYIDFAEFPMDKMPPFVKDRFTNNAMQIAGQDPALKGKKILFRDQTTAHIMAEVVVP